MSYSMSFPPSSGYFPDRKTLPTVTGVTVELMTAVQYTSMAEIIVEGGIRSRLESLVGHRREVRVIVALVVVVAVVALVLWMRGAPARIAPPATGDAAFAPATPAPQASGGVTVVHVGGAVKRAGIFELAPGARVADAIEMAAPRANANLNALNLAELVVDGAKIDVPRRGESTDPAAANSTTTSPSAEASSSTVNINTADATLLDTIPEVGPATAQAIIEYRTQVGTFTSVEELIEVSGIGPATLEAMRPFVTV
jgi:competence protein ComEA